MNHQIPSLKIPDGKKLFVIMGMMRSGSNLLQQKLNAIQGVLCHGEIFNPAQHGIEMRCANSSLMVEELAKMDKKEEPYSCLNRILEISQAEHIGFRLFENHNNDLIVPLIDDPRIFKIILIRDFLESYVSLEIARQTDQWLMNNPGTRREWQPVKVNFDAFKNYALRQSLFYYEIVSRCMLSGQKCLTLEYPKLNDASTDEKLLSHFGAERKVNKAKITAQRQNPEPLAEKIENFDEIRGRLQKLRLNRWLLIPDSQE